MQIENTLFTVDSAVLMNFEVPIIARTIQLHFLSFTLYIRDLEQKILLRLSLPTNGTDANSHGAKSKDPVQIIPQLPRQEDSQERTEKTAYGNRCGIAQYFNGHYNSSRWVIFRIQAVNSPG